MQILKFTPTQAFFSPGQPIQVKLILSADQPAAATLRIKVSQLQMDVAVLEKELTLEMGETPIEFQVPSPSASPQSYGLYAELVDLSGQRRDFRYAAVDTLAQWTDFPRYGFLTNFSPHRTDLDAALDSLVDYHINGLQFYDWQYRHDTLLPSQDEFTDPLGRPLSLPTIRSLVARAHSRGMAAMPYLAVYAASLPFWANCPAWRLFDEQGQPLKFEDFLGLMNPAPDCPWIDHLTRQCETVLTQIPFDGLHVDQYGEPKVAFDHAGEAVDIPQAFKAFANRLKAEFPDKSVVFNAVGNWPIDELASAQVDFVYIEIWPPDCSFQDLQRIVSEAREKSGGKPVVIALYLPADRPVNVRLANAVIMASGGTRIELGENGRLLADPYFPKHAARSPELAQTMQSYQDFLVRYGQVLGPAAATEAPTAIQFPPDTLGTLRKNGNWWAVNVVNLAGLESPRWDEKQPAPTLREDLLVTIPVPETPQKVWLASPDDTAPEMQPLPFTCDQGKVSLRLPKLFYWSILLIQFENEDF